MLQIAIAVAGGPDIPGIEVNDRGAVLYAALEEPAAGTAARLRKLSDGGEWLNELHFVYELLPPMGGGAEPLEALVEQLKPRLLVLDTLSALVKASKQNSDVFRTRYAEVARLRQLCEKSRVAALLVHHTRKGAAETTVEAIAGTGGISAAADTLWRLKRRPEGEAMLEVVGREVEERAFAMRFESGEPFGWHFLGDGAAAVMSAERREQLDLLREEGAMSPKQIAAGMAKSRPAVRMMVKRMVSDGLLRKSGTKYGIPSISVSYRVTEIE